MFITTAALSHHFDGTLKAELVLLNNSHISFRLFKITSIYRYVNLNVFSDLYYKIIKSLICKISSHLPDFGEWVSFLLQPFYNYKIINCLIVIFIAQFYVSLSV